MKGDGKIAQIKNNNKIRKEILNRPATNVKRRKFSCLKKTKKVKSGSLFFTVRYALL